MSRLLGSESCRAIVLVVLAFAMAIGVRTQAFGQCTGGGTSGGNGLVPQISVGTVTAGQTASVTVSNVSPSATRVYLTWSLNPGCIDVSSQFGAGATLVPNLRPNPRGSVPPYVPSLDAGLSAPTMSFSARVPPRWAGRTVYAQAFVQDGSAQAGGYALSDGITVTVGGTGGQSSVSEFGITWTFDRSYPVGQFANGDWWVVGPVAIVNIDPPSTTTGGRTINGSMVNPDPVAIHGYDSAMYGQYENGEYHADLNKALGVSSGSPLLLRAGSSLVSTISVPEAGAEPQIQTAAILTVLDSAPAAGSFRPPYSGSDKSIRFNRSQLQPALLASLPVIPGTPDLATVERFFERPWIDHVPGWMGRYHHPADNMLDYGRDLTDQISTGALLLQMNFTPAEKDRLLVRYVQLGIDLYGVVQAGGIHNWTPNGGHGSGRKWPILFAGLMLGDSPMSNIGFDSSVEFGEDGQTFYVSESSPGVIDYGYGGYDSSDIGIPEWGIRHSTDPSADVKAWYGQAYRTCCTANAWWGIVLSARVMRVQPLWNHDALFDYMDRYRQVCIDVGAPSWQVSWTDFPVAVWDAYRSQF
jgi:hypothetical protein